MSSNSPDDKSPESGPFDDEEKHGSGLNGHHHETGATAELSLKLPLGEAPPTITDLARSCVEFVRRATGITLDYTPDTLSVLDHYVKEAGEQLNTRPETHPLIRQAIGAYFGEVIRRRFASWWHIATIDPDDWELRMRDHYLAVLPVAIADASLTNGRDDPSFLKLDETEQEDLENYLSSLAGVSEEDFFLPSTRYDMIETVAEFLHAMATERGHSGVTFTDEDYEE